MESVDPAEPNVSSVRWYERLAAVLAIIGGLLLCFVALLVTASVSYLFGRPLMAEFEFVQVLCAVAAFAFLAHAQARSGHIAVDTFTLKLPRRLNAGIDGVWDLVFAGFFGFFAWGLFTSGLEKRSYGETLTQITWPIWPVYIACSILVGLACVVALAVAWEKFRGRS